MQTVKTGGLSQTGELESPAPGGRVRLEAIPDIAIREEIIRQVNGATLSPVCETLCKRSTSELSLENGTRAELAIDGGEIRAGGRSAELHEAEIELLEGSPAGLFDIARTLFPEGGLQFSRFSKSARGYLLAEEGWIDPALAPRNALKIAVDRAQIAEQAARDILRDCLDQVGQSISGRPPKGRPPIIMAAYHLPNLSSCCAGSTISNKRSGSIPAVPSPSTTTMPSAAELSVLKSLPRRASKRTRGAPPHDDRRRIGQHQNAGDRKRGDDPKHNGSLPRKQDQNIDTDGNRASAALLFGTSRRQFEQTGSIVLAALNITDYSKPF